MKKLKFLGAAVLVAFGLAALGATEARAALTVTLDTGPTELGPNDFLYEYRITLATDDEVSNQEDGAANDDFFVIVDFAGYIDGTATGPAGWEGTDELTTTVPPPDVVLTGDDPTIPNLRFTYTDGPVIVGPDDVLGFLAESIFDETTFGQFVARVTKNEFSDDPGADVDSIGTLVVPTGRDNVIPEPSTIVVAGMGGVALLLFRRRKATTV